MLSFYAVLKSGILIKKYYMYINYQMHLNPFNNFCPYLISVLLNRNDNIAVTMLAFFFFFFFFFLLQLFEFLFYLNKSVKLIIAVYDTKY